MGLPCGCPIKKGTYGGKNIMLNFKSPIRVPKGNYIFSFFEWHNDEKMILTHIIHEKGRYVLEIIMSNDQFDRVGCVKIFFNIN